MTQAKTSQTVRRVMSWMAQSLATGEPIQPDQVRTWSGALATALDGLESRETAAALIEQQKARIQDRVPQAYAAQLTDSIHKAVKRVAEIAQDNADPKQLPAIDNDACRILEGVIVLTMGVVRPQDSFADEVGG